MHVHLGGQCSPDGQHETGDYPEERNVIILVLKQCQSIKAPQPRLAEMTTGFCVAAIDASLMERGVGVQTLHCKVVEFPVALMLLEAA